MMKYLTAVVLSLTIIGATMATAPTAQAHGRRYTKCRYQSVDGRHGFSSLEVRYTIRCVASHFGVSTSEALYVANRESGFGAYARNSSSGTCGVFQHMPQYFAERLAAVPDHFRRWQTSCYNARSNILAALWMVHRYGWGAWTTA